MFLPENFSVSDWDSLLPWYENLLNRPLDSVSDLEQWLLDRGEFEGFLSEDFYLRYVAVTVNTRDEEAAARFQYAVQHIQPYASQQEDLLNRKLALCPFLDLLPADQYAIYLRGVRNDLELFREENIPLFTEIEIKQKEYGVIFGAMTVEHEGAQLTLAQARALLENPDRAVRETIFFKINALIAENAAALDNLFDELLTLRRQVAQQAGFENFRDYKFRELGRFDYTPDDCLAFHQSVEEVVVPLVDKFNRIRREKLGLEELRPWDIQVDWSGRDPLRPFSQTAELLDKTIQCLGQVDPFFGQCLETMRDRGRLDLDSRPAKSPGGYNMPLHHTGIPFIFMNAAGTFTDVTTLLHESGHAVHSFLMRAYPLNYTKQPPSEVAELASMSMELLTMDQWEAFLPTEEDLLRARIEQLESVLRTLPWVATIDAFQHWIYTHPGHSQAERREAWMNTYLRFHSREVNISGLEDIYSRLWLRQLHLFEVPFYYIEYGIAQLGAVGVWMNFRENPKQALADYKSALALGYSRSIAQVYETAGVPFDFSRPAVERLMGFVESELEKLLA